MVRRYWNVVVCINKTAKTKRRRDTNFDTKIDCVLKC